MRSSTRSLTTCFAGLFLATLLAACGAKPAVNDQLAHAKLLPGGMESTTVGTPAALAAPSPLPALAGQAVQFLGAMPDSQYVFAGVDGALLRSTDGGKHFNEIIPQARRSGGRHVRISRVLFPAQRANAVVVAGIDTRKGRPYLAWSWNRGNTWIDLSSLLHESATGSGQGPVAMKEDAHGRVLLSMNDAGRANEQVVAVTLGLLY